MTISLPVLPSPTARLPAIKHISLQSSEDLLECLRYLRVIYSPAVRGSKRRKTAVGTQSGNIACDTDWQVDTFERAHSIRWLTGLVSRCEREEIVGFEALIQEAASLLALCSGSAGAGVIRRNFILSPSVQVTLTDLPLENADFDSMGAQTWGGACVLAEMMVEAPESFGFRPTGPSGLRVLELGAGTGLVSLTVGKLLQSGNIMYSLVATDFFPLVLANLQSNITANYPVDAPIVACFLDWATFADGCIQPELPHDEFDIVLGADIMYEPQHVRWIKACLRKLLRSKTAACPSGLFHLVIPRRPTHSSEMDMIESVFASRPGDIGIMDKETIVCDADTETDSDTVEYTYYKIGWV